MGGMDTQQLEENLPKGPTGEVTSMGSVLHASGRCRPCRYIVAAKPCSMGMRCSYCHLPHESTDGDGDDRDEECRVEDDRDEGTTGRRPSKAQRLRYRRLVEEMETEIRADPFGWNIKDAKMLPSMEQNPELKQTYLGRLASIRDAVQREIGGPSSSAAPAEGIREHDTGRFENYNKIRDALQRQAG